MMLADRMNRLGTETAFEVLAAARALEMLGREVFHLEIGEPDFPTADFIVEAAVQALRDGWHHYVPAPGIPELREAVAENCSTSRGIPVNPEEVVVTPGAKPIIFFTLLALAEPGVEVIYPNPGFPIYESMIRFVGATPVPAPLREELDFRMDVDELRERITDRTRLIIINSPNNPTGSILTGDDLSAIANACLERDLFILSDEIYSRLLYDGPHLSIASIPGMKERTIILDGFSKSYAMTGWRLGYGVAPPPIAQAITRLMINSNSCTAAFTQKAGVAALQGDQSCCSRMLETFRTRRNRVVPLLNQIDGVNCRTPRGAFYAFPSVRDVSLPALELQRLLLKEAGVALLSGTSFGSWGEGFLRISYATSLDILEEGIRRIAEVIGNLASGNRNSARADSR
jgi:aspartate/methionine/tyrosine aminotransferase